ncbi:TetR family transcriptional regulator [Sphingomonas bacterium]|uniref:TetR/AcrR family transcriptional regulator n=1 Tax=Sphingomonas bacterium TaxID=1895847 RepID=UPI001575A63B|nr:TetR family transcriptional regulator [Sphingomonas bacterium]
MSDADDAPSPVRRGRRSGDSTTRQAILAAARSRFAEDGYAATTIRKVAADAGVDPALILQFFQSKEGLFGAMMAISPDALARIVGAFDGPGQGLGERVVRAFLALWEGPAENAEPLLAMVRAAVSNEHASAQLREFFQTRLQDAISPKLNRPDAAMRAGFASAMLVGVIIGRRIVCVPALADGEQEAVVRLLGPAIQVVLIGDVAP